jgi:hypothetical protein
VVSGYAPLRAQVTVLHYSRGRGVLGGGETRDWELDRDRGRHPVTKEFVGNNVISLGQQGFGMSIDPFPRFTGTFVPGKALVPDWCDQVNHQCPDGMTGENTP